ncbi:MAG TPA: nitroreductase family deazaflavin-dependent oxidoreductase [Polyangiaceae bacterium]|jgi:deazaflavin-dependent oxidoreductase (nitroreductase family)
MTQGSNSDAKPLSWQEQHMREYLESGGKEGHIWHGVPTLLLTTTGHKSGQERMTPLIYGRDGDHYLIVASRGGTPDHPSWYKNLVAHPDIEIQVGPDRIKARARTASAAEKPALWKKMTAIWPQYDEYQTKTSREIPVVVIEPSQKP